MATYRANFPDLLEPVFRKIFDDRYKELPQEFPTIYSVSNSGKQQEKDSAVSGFGLLELTPEGGAINYEDPVQMYDKTYTHLKYTKGFKISEEMYEDDQYNVMKKKPKALGRAVRRTADYYGAQAFNNAFNTANPGGDGVPMCSTVHPRSDGGTAQSNASATGITLTDQNLAVGRIAMRGQLDDKGMRILAKANTILTGVELEDTAKRLVGSAKRPGVADNDINVHENAYTLRVWDYITSDTAWFLLGDDRELNWFWRIRPEFKQDDRFDTGMGCYKTRIRFSYGWSDWRAIWGSQGDGAAYAD